MHIVNMSSCCAHEEPSFACLDDLDNIFILLDKDNDFEEEITQFINEVSIFISKFEKKHNHSGSKYTQSKAVISGNFE